MTMATEDPFTDRLSDYLDGEDLSPTERAEIEAHLATCATCQTTLAELAAVAARARSLPDRAPVADLWAGVSRRLTPARQPFCRSSSRHIAASRSRCRSSSPPASRSCCFRAEWCGWRGSAIPRTSLPSAVAQVAPDEGAPAGPATKTPNPASALSRVAFADPNYDQAVADLEKMLEANRSRLDPETVRILEANLQTIDQAIDQSRKALRADPANVYLNNHFAASRNRKIALLRRASALAMTQDAVGGS